MQSKKSSKAAFTLIDMHSHSTESDGDLTAEQVEQEAASTYKNTALPHALLATPQTIAKAKQLGVDTLWVTDHDMIRTPERAQQVWCTSPFKQRMMVLLLLL